MIYQIVISVIVSNVRWLLVRSGSLGRFSVVKVWVMSLCLGIRVSFQISVISVIENIEVQKKVVCRSVVRWLGWFSVRVSISDSMMKMGVLMSMKWMVFQMIWWKILFCSSLWQLFRLIQKLLLDSRLWLWKLIYMFLVSGYSSSSVQIVMKGNMKRVQVGCEVCRLMVVVFMCVILCWGGWDGCDGYVWFC